MQMLGKWRTNAWIAVALLAGCAGEETVFPATGAAPPSGGQIAPAITGGVPVTSEDLATGGMTLTGGTATSSGGTTAFTGGNEFATGGTTASTGGTSTSTGGTTASTGGAEPPPIDLDMLFPPPTPPSERKPDPNNPPECPAVAPENPVGDCAGLPIYVNCKYGTYNCICDWYHWLCAG